jgi:hypothetical protein
MANGRKKKTDLDRTTATEEATALLPPPTDTTPGDGPPPETNGAPAGPPPAAPALDNGNNNGDRRPLQVFSYLVGAETYVQCSVWQRDVQRRDGSAFTAYDCSVRKRYRDGRDGEWKSLYSFHASELYAVQHAFEQAARYIADLRAADVPF